MKNDPCQPQCVGFGKFPRKEENKPHTTFKLLMKVILFKIHNKARERQEHIKCNDMLLKKKQQ